MLGLHCTPVRPAYRRRCPGTALLLPATAPPPPPLSPPLARSLALPVHLALALALAARSPDVCASACLSGPAAEQTTRRAFAALSALRVDVFRGAGMPALPAASQCAVVLTYLQVALGFLLPALVHAALECRLFARHQRERRRAGLPPERGLQAAAYEAAAGLLGALSWPQALLALGIALSVAFDLSLLAA